MSLSFWYPVVHFVQPGILWPDLAPFYPLQIANILVLITCLAKLGDRRTVDAFKHPAFYWMIFFVLIIRSLSVVSSSMSAALSEVIFNLPIAVFVILSILLANSEKNLRRYILGMMLGSMFIVGYGIYALHTGMRDVQWGGLAGAYGMYANHNDYTFIIIQVFPFLYLYRRAGTGFLRNGFLYAAMAACIYGMLVSRSRGGVLAMVLEVVLIILLTKTRKQQFILLPIVLILGGAAISYQFTQRASLSAESGYTQQKAESSRFELWKAGQNMFLAHPILGVGSQRFAEFAKDYYDLSYDQRGKVAHNTYIQVAATTGILGIIGFLATLIAVRRELRIKNTGGDLASLEWIRAAALIFFYTILFRALFDSKDHDWGFYLLVVIASLIHGLRSNLERPVTANGTVGGTHS